MQLRILVSAGEPSGDLYAAGLVERLRKELPGAEFFGCAGPRMRSAGVRPVARMENLAVVGLFEVVRHLPRVYSELRRMKQAARDCRPKLAILTDSPDFHLRLAPSLRRAGIPVVQFVAPQVWAWRPWRLGAIRRNINLLLCIFPFEEDYFRRNGVNVVYTGHPLVSVIKPARTREQFFAQLGLSATRPLVALLPGSRRPEAFRHLPVLLKTIRLIDSGCPAQFVMGSPAGFWRPQDASLRARLEQLGVRQLEGETWDLLAHCDLALAASGTVTVEAAFLGAPVVSFYKVSALTWHAGRHLVRVPFYTMINLIAGQRVIPELIQHDFTPERLAREALNLLQNEAARDKMRSALAEVARRLASDEDPLQKAAAAVHQLLGCVYGVTHAA